MEMDLTNYDWYNEDILCAFQPATDFYEYRQYAYPLLPLDSSPKSRLLNFMGLPSSSNDAVSSSGVSSVDIDAQSPISDAAEQSIANCPASPDYCSVPERCLSSPADNADISPDDDQYTAFMKAQIRAQAQQPTQRLSFTEDDIAYSKRLFDGANRIDSVANCNRALKMTAHGRSTKTIDGDKSDRRTGYGDQLGQRYSPYWKPLSLIERQLMYQLCSDVSSGLSPLPPSDIANYKLSSPSMSPLPNYSYC